MLTIPARLFGEDFIRVHFRKGTVCFLKKDLSKSALDRHSYLSQPVLAWLERGRQRIESYDGEVISVPSGSLAVYRPGIYTINDLVAGKEGFQSFLFFFDEKWLIDLPGILKAPLGTRPSAQPPIGTVIATPPVQAFFRQLENQLSCLPDLPADFLYLKWRELTYLLACDPSGQPILSFLANLGWKKQRNIRQLMEKHFDKPLRIPDYAYLSGRSESTFRREFKQRYGQSPGQWLIKKRMDKARQLLRETDFAVSSVALESGYENVSHFIQVFKSYFAQTPAEFQQMAGMR